MGQPADDTAPVERLTPDAEGVPEIPRRSSNRLAKKQPIIGGLDPSLQGRPGAYSLQRERPFSPCSLISGIWQAGTALSKVLQEGRGHRQQHSPANCLDWGAPRKRGLDAFWLIEVTP